jgi:hypothetical protein
MQIEFIVNGGVSLLVSPENEMEEHLLKQMMKQDNDMTEIRMNIMVLNKTFKSGILIGKKSSAERNSIDKDTDAEQKETV